MTTTRVVRTRSARRGSGRTGSATTWSAGTRRLVRWLVLGGLLAATALITWRTASIASVLERVAVLGVLLGLAVAFGGLEPRRRVALTAPGKFVPDARTAQLAAGTLDSLDRIEHRSVELGSPWPRLVVGPTGVAVVDISSLKGPVEISSRGVHGAWGQRLCPPCRASAAIADSLRASLEEGGIAAPVRFIAVVPERTPVTVDLDAPTDVTAISVDELADVLSRGPLLSMGTVDQAFAHLTRTAATPRGLVPG